MPDGPGTTAVPVVHIEHFAMGFGDRRVIDDLSFDVYAGDTFGFLGSNGAGKTTTIRALLGIYEPQAGVLEVNGRPFTPGSSGELGYLPEERGLYKKEPTLDTMVYFGRLKGMTAKDARVWSLRYLERVGLPDKAGVNLEKLSGGEQQKVQLGVTIMGHPSLLILDEPTKGFDPVNRRLLMDIIDEQKTNGATVMMVTHQMDDVERICDRIVLLKDGHAHAYGTVAEVQEQFGGTTVRLRYEGVPRLPAREDCRVLSDADGSAELALTPGVEPAELLAWLLGQGVSVSSFTPGRRSLDSIFIEVYGDESGRA
ncbi:MAG: ATP-binding cassette domain-containing protein [Actinomycetia bacterium]|nr:ATP-binding cassette domain-containing protein [Actinomycetes bacterium]